MAIRAELFIAAQQAGTASYNGGQSMVKIDTWLST
jgi:hypothetical protein